MVLLDEQRQFIREHLSASVAALLLKYGKNREVEIRQIEARQKAKQKLPSWYAEERLIFPPAVSVEQSSSETTGRYKAALVSGTLIEPRMECSVVVLPEPVGPQTKKMP